jgi:single-stranded-DNA-specific exonuclease
LKLRLVRRSADPLRVAALSALHPVLARAYAARGIDDPAQLGGELARLLPVGSLDGIAAAVDLLLAHRSGSAGILVIGDFDADGATSTALLVRALRAFGFARVDFLVPNRFEFGYGLTPEIVALAARSAPALIITVDNGISSHAGVAAARALGIDVLVTDHHLAPGVLPAANVIVNPNLPGASFGSRALAGVGVAFYVVAALRRALEQRGLLPAAGAPGPVEWLDLVALGTVADLVPLDQNNRVLVAQGLRRIRAGRCVPGIRALLEAGGRALDMLTAADLGFTVAPRLNAAGRLDDMAIGIRCLLADSATEAAALATRLDELNRERRTIEARMQADAIAATRSLEDMVERAAPGAAPGRRGICLYDAAWHQGVVGLVASRIKDRVRRPVVAFADNADGTLRGSARSVAGVHVRDVLEAIATRDPALIVRFGGHAMAAGLTIARGDLDRFAAAFDREVGAVQGSCALADQVETDGELALDEISLVTAQAMREGGPWGQAFPEPSFDGRFRVHSSRTVGEKHLKLWVEPQDSGRRFEAIAFNYHQGRAPGGAVPESVQLVYRLDVNHYQGERRLQLLVDHLLE